MQRMSGLRTDGVRADTIVRRWSFGAGSTRHPFRRSLVAGTASLALGLMCLVGLANREAAAQFLQQGSKLTGSGETGGGGFGGVIAVSADGNTALIGASSDSADAGAAWVFTRTGGVWTQQGSKLTPSDEAGAAEFGFSVALSADGNTALIGGLDDTTAGGAAWIFTRSGNSWTEGAKITAAQSGQVGFSGFGSSVALSAAGTTALIGGIGDNGAIGAAWVFTGSGSNWNSLGVKLVGSGYVKNGGFEVDEGASAALSADGNTALIGGPFDNNVGAAWVFTRSGNSWTQQGSKLTGSGETGNGAFGNAVALSADGNTALIGGYLDNITDNDTGATGAAWVFGRSGGTWTQQGGKLTASDESGNAEFGTSVALSSNGNAALIGGPFDNNFAGAAWVFTRLGTAWNQLGAKFTASDGSEFGQAVALSAGGNTAIAGSEGDSAVGAAWAFIRTVPTNTHDFNGDSTSDILWGDSSGDLAMWLMSAGQESSGAAFGNVGTSWSVVGQRDFNGDGDADILWLDNAGDLALWLMNGLTVGSEIGLGNVGAQWQVAGTGDFNGDGTGDILWRNSSTGDVTIWLMNSGQLSSGVDIGDVPSNWQIAGTGDFNGDGTSDILWRDASTGDVAIWFMSNGQFSSAALLGTVPLTWQIVGTGDFNGDETSDILWRDTSGDLGIWLMSNGQMAAAGGFSGVPTTWSVAETGDFDRNGASDILWLDQSGDLGVWLMDGLTISSALGVGNVGTSWQVQGRSSD